MEPACARKLLHLLGVEYQSDDVVDLSGSHVAVARLVNRENGAHQLVHFLHVCRQQLEEHGLGQWLERNLPQVFALEVARIAGRVLRIIFGIIIQLQLIVYLPQLVHLLGRVHLLHVDVFDTVRCDPTISREQHLMLSKGQAKAKDAIEDGLELVVLDALIIVVRSAGILMKLLFESVPFLVANLEVNLLVKVFDFVHVHLGMDRAEVARADRLLPAERVLAAFTSSSRLFLERVLPEVRRFTWMNLVTHSQVEVLVRYLAIAVDVKEFVDVAELRLGYLEAPMVQIELQLRRRDSFSVGILVHVFERFKDTGPLLADLHDNVLLELLRVQLALGAIRLFATLLLFFKVPLILRIAHRVVPKEEALGHMDAVADPGTKVHIVQLAHVL